MANINIPFNCDYESINITVKCPIEGTDKEEQTIIAQLKKDQNDWVFCTPGSIVSKNVKILNNEGSYEVIDSNGNFKGKIVGDILSEDGKVILSVSDNKVTTKDLVVSDNTIVNNLTINGKLTVKNGSDIIQINESSVPENKSIVILDNNDGIKTGLVVKNGLKSEFIGFSKENNMFEIKTGTSISGNDITGGEFGDLKARTIVADDVILGNKNKGETVINIHDVITADEKGTAHLTTNSITTVHHSSVFHTAISYDNNFSNTEETFLNSLSGDVREVFLKEKLGGINDGNLGNKYTLGELKLAVKNNNKNKVISSNDYNKIFKSNLNESYNQHWLTINEAKKDPKFHWWVASNGDYHSSAQKNNSIEYKNVLTVKKEGVDIDGLITVKNDNKSISVTADELDQLKKLLVKNDNIERALKGNLSGDVNKQVMSNSVEIESLKKIIENLTERLSMYESVLPVVDNLQPATIKSTKAHNSYNSFPLIHKNNNEPKSVTIVNYKKENKNVYYYQLNSDNRSDIISNTISKNIDPTSYKKLNDEVNEIKKRLNKREIIPIISDKSQLKKSIGKSTPYFLVSGKGEKQTIKFINKYIDDKEEVHYHYQLNSYNDVKGTVNDNKTLKLIEEYARYLPIVKNDDKPTTNGPYIKVNTLTGKISLMNYIKDKNYYYQLNN